QRFYENAIPRVASCDISTMSFDGKRLGLGMRQTTLERSGWMSRLDLPKRAGADENKYEWIGCHFVIVDFQSGSRQQVFRLAHDRRNFALWNVLEISRGDCGKLWQRCGLTERVIPQPRCPVADTL